MFKAALYEEGGGCWRGHVWLAGGLVNPRSVHSLAWASADDAQLPPRKEDSVQLRWLYNADGYGTCVTGIAWLLL